jgi:hypothetical protein
MTLFKYFLITSIFLSLNIVCKPKSDIPKNTANKKELTKGNKITKIFTSPKYDTVYFLMSDSSKQILVADKDSVFGLLFNTSDNNWGLFSVMSQDPNYARGTAEGKALFNLPLKRRIWPNELGLGEWVYRDLVDDSTGKYVVIGHGEEEKNIQLNDILKIIR